MKKSANEEKYRSTDPLYGLVRARSGKMVSGGAGLLVRAAAMGGPTAMIERAQQNLLREIDAAVRKRNIKSVKRA